MVVIGLPPHHFPWLIAHLVVFMGQLEMVIQGLEVEIMVIKRNEAPMLKKHVISFFWYFFVNFFFRMGFDRENIISLAIYFHELFYCLLIRHISNLPNFGRNFGIPKFFFHQIIELMMKVVSMAKFIINNCLLGSRHTSHFLRRLRERSNIC